MTNIEAKPEQRQRLDITSKLRKLINETVSKHNALKDARPELGFREYTFENGLQAVDEHRLAAYGRIDAEMEAGRITPNEAQNQKHKWNTQHGYRG